MNNFKDKKILVTGGTGSFGNVFIKKYLNNFGEIRVFSRDEKKQYDMNNTYHNDKLKFYIGDIRDINSINHAMKDVDYVFHAAAMKHVPICEKFPMEAVYTNVIGTENVLDSAIKNKVKKVVVLSTDKACYPTCAMGLSKALMEKISINKSTDTTKICCTRFGNVMCSRGSVIPLFIDQILNNKNLTITNPNMTRFMMSLNDAVELVMYAFKNCNGGEIFVKKSVACKISTLANALIRIFDGKSKIDIIGSRPGEKIHETLVTSLEMNDCYDCYNFFKIYKDINNIELPYNKVSVIRDYKSNNTEILNVNQMIDLLIKDDYIKSKMI